MLAHQTKPNSSTTEYIETKKKRLKKVKYDTDRFDIMVPKQHTVSSNQTLYATL